MTGEVSLADSESSTFDHSLAPSCSGGGYNQMAAEGYVLESAPSMDGPWTPVETAPEVHGDQTRLTVLASDTMRFLRLRRGG